LGDTDLRMLPPLEEGIRRRLDRHRDMGSERLGRLCIPLDIVLWADLGSMRIEFSWNVDK
jgi:hypothetical protein